MKRYVHRHNGKVLQLGIYIDQCARRRDWKRLSTQSDQLGAATSVCMGSIVGRTGFRQAVYKYKTVYHRFANVLHVYIYRGSSNTIAHAFEIVGIREVSDEDMAAHTELT